MACIGFHDDLQDHRRYERLIARLEGGCRRLCQGDVSLSGLSFHRSKVAKLLARAVGQGQYLSAPARRKTIVVGGKERVIFTYCLTDLIVHGTVADLIAEALEPSLSPHLYSYRKGTAWWQAVSDFARYLRNHRKAESDPTRRHMYVIRRDIEAYTDSIPVGAGAPVWKMLRDLLASPDRPPLAAPDWALLERVVRPEVEVLGGSPVRLERGVATGQPISCVLFNLYLTDLDRRLDAVPGGYYARYSDDILFAHPQPAVVQEASAQIDAVLNSLGLRVKATKSRDLYLTGAGRSSSEWPEAVGTSTVPFMGASIRADSTISLARKKTRKLLRDIAVRAQRTARALPGASVEDQGRMVCAIVNRMLQPDSATYAEARSAALLRRAITDRKQLAQLDHCIARMVLKAVTGDGGVRRFRAVPYRKIREQWGLVSLEHARNLLRRGRRRWRN